ncbi:MAG: hypothetical protein LBU89_06750 [Fibromonadaceae bacterium]|nr:hypothetical protein [Fibromonadaceae bacterium]
MKIRFLWALLLANLCAHSNDTGIVADADYCFDFRHDYPRLALVKQNNDLEIMLTAEEYLICDRYAVSWRYSFDLVDSSDKHVITFWLWRAKGIANATLKIKPVMPVISPPFMFGRDHTTEVSNEKLLMFVGDIFNTYTILSLGCTADSSTTYYTHNISIRITGECEGSLLIELDQSDHPLLPCSTIQDRFPNVIPEPHN